LVRTGNPFDQYTSGPPDDFADMLMGLGYSQTINYPIRPYRPPPVSTPVNQTTIRDVVPGADIGFGGEPQPGDIDYNVITAGPGGLPNLNWMGDLFTKDTEEEKPKDTGLEAARRKKLEDIITLFTNTKATYWVAVEGQFETPADQAEYMMRQSYIKYRAYLNATSVEEIDLIFKSSPQSIEASQRNVYHKILSSDRDTEYEQRLAEAFMGSMFTDLPSWIADDPENALRVGFENIIPSIMEMLPDATFTVPISSQSISGIKAAYLLNPKAKDTAARMLRRAYSKEWYDAEGYADSYETQLRYSASGDIPEEYKKEDIEEEIRRLINAWDIEIETTGERYVPQPGDVDYIPDYSEQDLDGGYTGGVSNEWVDTDKDEQITRDMPSTDPQDWTKGQILNMNINSTTKAMHKDDYLRNNLRHRYSSPDEKMLFEYQENYLINPQYDVQSMLGFTDMNYGAQLHRGVKPWSAPELDLHLGRFKQLVGGNIWDPVKKTYDRIEGWTDPVFGTVASEIEKQLDKETGFEHDIDPVLTTPEIASEYIQNPDNVKKLIMASSMSKVGYGLSSRWMPGPLARSIDNYMNLNYQNQMKIINMPGSPKDDVAQARAEIGIGMYKEFAITRNNNWLRTDEIKKNLDNIYNKDDNKNNLKSDLDTTGFVPNTNYGNQIR
jgi:hypothetical protein